MARKYTPLIHNEVLTVRYVPQTQDCPPLYVVEYGQDLTASVYSRDPMTYDECAQFAVENFLTRYPTFGNLSDYAGGRIQDDMRRVFVRHRRPKH